MEPTNISCICTSQPLRDVKDFIKENGLKTVEDVKVFCGAGTKCGLCIPFIQKILESNE
jgi:NAD(P)H-nitrite reductase large subunit